MKKRQPASICYVELPAPDAKKAAAFYSAAFGWNARPSGLTAQDYWMFDTGGGLMGGFDPARPVAGGGPLLYIEVKDIPAALKAVKRAGGAAVSRKKAIGGGYGYFAVFKDPNGNKMGLWARK